MEQLCKKLGYQFQDMSVLTQALTHRSYDAADNERLEFLGDALLGFIITNRLFVQYPNMTEGQLSRLRANLVNGEVLATLSDELAISQYMRLGQGEIKSGGMKRRSILSNSVEALIGAIYLDGGIAACEKAVLAWYADKFEKIAHEGPKKDPKTELQEYLQAKKMALPLYIVLEMGGRENNPIFRVQCQVQDLAIQAFGEGTSRRRAEQSAAENFLAMVEKT